MLCSDRNSKPPRTEILSSPYCTWDLDEGSQCQVKDFFPFPWSMSVSLVMQPRTSFVSFAARARYLLMSSPQVLCCRDAPQGVSQWPVLLFVCSQMQDWHFSFLSFRRFLLDHSSICLSFTAWQLCPKFTDWSAQSGVICKLSDHTLYPLWQGLGKDAKQVRAGPTQCTQHQLTGSLVHFLHSLVN